MVYLYYFRILLHFIGKKILYLPLFFFRNFRKIYDMVEARDEGSET